MFALAHPNITGLLQGEHPEILAGIGYGVWGKVAFGVHISNISETPQDMTKVTTDDQ